MDTNLSDEERQSGKTKSKIDALSREDLIRFVKKQLENARKSDIEAKKLKHLLEERELAIRDLLTENATLKKKPLRENIDVNSSDKAVVSDVVSTDSSESLIELNAILASQLAQLKKERSRIDDDLAAALQINNELRYQLENAIQEATAVQEQRTATDLFSLELKDYEKKMVQLNKSLKDTEIALETSNTEKEKLIQQLETHKASTDRMNADCLALQRELQDVRNKLHEEQCSVRELTSTIDKLQHNSNVLITAKNDERVNFEARIARNEELLAYWQKSCEQKSADLIDLLAENRMLKTRCHNLEDDFLSYKSRARYVLEQQAKAVENGTTSNQVDMETVQQSLVEVMGDLEELCVADKSLIIDARKCRDQYMKYESFNRTLNAHALELQQKLMRTNEELLNSNVMLELRAAECLKYQSQVSNMEEEMQDLIVAKEKALLLMDVQIANKSLIETELACELEKEKIRCEEALRRLSEFQNERARVSPVSSICLHHSGSEHLIESNFLPSRQCSKMSPSALIEDETQRERSLEDVLFGEDLMDIGSCSNANMALSSLMDEKERLVIQLRHTRELLKDAEATNATLIEQSVLLKDEIRRLERNRERLSHFENSEYLKNIIVKFLSPERVSGERIQLVPILTTMLRLSPDETELLNRAASQDEVAHGETENTWGSYLRWGRLN